MLKRFIFLNQRIVLGKETSRKLKNLLFNASKTFSTEKPKKLNANESDLKIIENINKILRENLNKEIENFYPIDENQLKSILNSQKFTLINNDNLKVIKLEKKFENKIINIIITPKQPDFTESENEKENSRLTSFFIVIKNENDNNGLLIDAVTLANKINITQINYSEDIDSFVSLTFNFNEVDQKAKNFVENEYKGPHFYTLDQTLQSSFYDLINYYGIDENIASVIDVLSIEKDQELYLNWLKNLNNF